MLDETTRVLAYSRRLEEKQRELEHATAELRDANEQLLELNRMKDDFMSAVTHELRTPLTSIRAFTEILNDDRELERSVQRSETLDIILKESEHLTHINQVLDFAKIESGTLEWRMEVQPVGPAVEESLHAQLGELLRRRRIDVVVDLGPNDLNAEFDHDRLIQVVFNLVSNAVEVQRPRRPTGMGVARPVGAGGVGDGEGQWPRRSSNTTVRFSKKFQQVTAGDSGKPGGTGLGLPISER